MRALWIRYSVLIGILAVLPAANGETDHPADVVAKYARNVRNYGAKGDGVTDDTEAFLRALQPGHQGKGAPPSPVTVYIPAGQYLVGSTLPISPYTLLAGEWTDPPTIILAPNGQGFRDAANPKPFLTTTGGPGVSTNNTYCIQIRDLNLRLGHGNPGAWGIYWRCAQATSLRNVTIDAGDSLGCLNLQGWGGGSVIADCHFIGGHQGLYASATSMEVIRDCTFNRQIDYSVFTWSGLSIFTFLGIDFINTAPIWICASDAYHPLSLNLVNCRFRDMPGAAFACLNRAEPFVAAFHVENMTFDPVSIVPDFLRDSAVNGKITQWSGSTDQSASSSAYPDQYYLPTTGPNGRIVFHHDEWISGTDQALNQQTYPGAWRTHPYPRPGPRCANIKDLGAKGNGVTDDTRVIIKALARHEELYFPNGSYVVRQPLVVRSGQHLFGEAFSQIFVPPDAAQFQSGSTKSVLTVEGNGAPGVVICGLIIESHANGGRTVSWKGDPSSIVMDFSANSFNASPLPTMTLEEGGGVFEGMEIGGSGLQREGMLIKSEGPTYIYQLSGEHYGTYSLVFEKAAHVLLSNWDGEDSGRSGRKSPGVTVKISHSNSLFLYNLYAAAYRKPAPDPLIELSNSQDIRLWNIQQTGLPYLIQDASVSPASRIGKVGNPQVSEVASDGMILCGYLRN